MIISLLQSFYNSLVFANGRMRARVLSLIFKKCGENVTIMKGFTFRSPKGISIGKDTFINYNCFFDGAGGLEIGDDCQLAQNVSIFTANHKFDKTNILIKDQGYIKEKVTVGKDVWIGANVTILPGVKIGSGSVIGAGAVVSRNIPAWSVAVGVPAKVVKKRK